MIQKDQQVAEIVEEIKLRLSQPNYPCVPAILSFENNQYMIGVYSRFGSGDFAKQLYNDLVGFKADQKRGGAPYLTFWAIFIDDAEMTETEFEAALWSELSCLSSAEAAEVPWDQNFSADPADANFSLSLDGEAFFVVGLHKGSSRKARQFKWPALVFNLHEQFEELFRQGKYESIVARNRSREIKFQGSLNPMVVEHGDKWESIQFSGKENASDWKCPFHRKASP